MIPRDVVIRAAIIARTIPFPMDGSRRPGVVDLLVAQGFNAKAVCSKIRTLVNKGYLDYGVSERYAWATPKGEAAVAAKLGNA